MTTAFEAFREVAEATRPRAAVVLGSGLGAAADRFAPVAEVAYADVPGMVPPTVRGHRGRLAVGTWAGVPAVVCFGRVHFYEGHPWERVTVLVRLLAGLGVRALVLTNAAGGIHPDLGPGSLMAIGKHIKLVEPEGWKRLLSWGREPPDRSGTQGAHAPSSETELPYSARCTSLLQQSESVDGRPLLLGTYAALTGPCYETPAEIRALGIIGVDAVGMSTAVEAETAAALGLDVVGLSCITNRAAGLSAGPLSHGEVEETAERMVGRVAELLGRFLPAI